MAVLPVINIPPTIPIVPFHSQLTEIHSPVWRLQSCGITSLSMIVDYYRPGAVSLNALLGQGIALGAFINNVGWSYSGLIQVAQKYDLHGKTYDLSSATASHALAQITASLKDGPVIASVHYKFDPKSLLPHMVVIDGIADNIVYYNDPDAKNGENKISTADFVKGWKKRFIVIRPTAKSLALASL